MRVGTTMKENGSKIRKMEKDSWCGRPLINVMKGNGKIISNGVLGRTYGKKNEAIISY